MKDIIRLVEKPMLEGITYEKQGLKTIANVDVKQAESVLLTIDVVKCKGEYIKTNGDKLRIFRYKGITCKCCGRKATIALIQKQKRQSNAGNNIQFYILNKDNSLNSMTIDHTVPHSLGGKTDLENLEPMCSDCNGSKKAECSLKDMLEYHAKLFNPNHSQAQYYDSKLECHMKKRALVMANGSQESKKYYMNKQIEELKQMVANGWRMKLGMSYETA